MKRKLDEPQWTKAQIETALAMKQQGFSYSQIGKMIGRTRHAVRAKMDRLEVNDAYTPRRGKSAPGGPVIVPTSVVTLPRVKWLERPDP